MKVACVLFKEEAPLHAFAEACLRFSPQIFVREPNAVILEIGKCRKLYSEESFLSRARVLLRRFGLTAEIGIAESIAHSVAASHCPGLEVADMPLTMLEVFFDPLLQNTKRGKILEKMIRALELVGFTKLGEFLDLPAHELPSRFGPVGVLCRHRLLGQIDTEWPAWKPLEKMIEREDLGYEAYSNEIDRLLFSVKPLVDRLFARLHSRGEKLSVLRLTFTFERFSTTPEWIRNFRFDFLKPQSSTLAVHPILRQRIDRDFTKKPIETQVVSIEAEVLGTTRSSSGQKNFFHNREEREEKRNAVLARMSESLGKDRVFQLHLHETRVPEKSWSRNLEPQKFVPDLKHHLPRRPTRFLKRPERVQVTESFIIIRQRTYRVLRWSSAEIIESDWLDCFVNRKYFTLVLEGRTPAVWVFQDATENFYLHGYFG